MHGIEEETKKGEQAQKDYAEGLKSVHKLLQENAEAAEQASMAQAKLNLENQHESAVSGIQT